ncbi:PTS sugar transporter subunit IIA [Thermobrachium celere]|uniref:Ascorbate-specific PTS system EIIA component n=1 Tax=Thermobrachium celere DSM 8682 TaxID=941824 RepID=R7RMM8_9CLOT|nr:PTS sugar transporter subunit IIA [Thermobrachium celere]CDF57432.1 PTS system, IIA component [Thermobrachium celere DSM 8682]
MRGTGIGTARIVSTQIKNQFDVEIVDTISYREISKLKYLNYDVIISTVELNSYDKEHYIKINPILLKHDYEKLEKILRRKYSNDINYENEIEIVNRFISIVEKYCTIQNKEHLIYELMYEIKKTKNVLQMGRRVYMLSDLLTEDMIRINVEANNWEEAIREGTKIMKKKNYVEECYEETIINNIKTLGPYMVIAPGIVLSHARPENGVKKLSMSLTLLKNPVVFGHETNDPVKLVITIAAVDNETHLKALSQLMELLMNEVDMERIFNAKSKDEIISIINKYKN